MDKYRERNIAETKDTYACNKELLRFRKAVSGCYEE